MIGLLVILGYAYHQRLFGLNQPAAAGSTQDMPLVGGGVSDGSKCGTKGYQYFAVSTVTDIGGMLPGTPAGPAMVLGSYGAEVSGQGDPGEFTISFSLATGSSAHSLDLTAPFGALGVAVEIEGPNGLVGGAHNLPVTLDDPSARLPNGKIRVGNAYGLSAELKLPAAALCPGYDVMDVNNELSPPSDSHDTITGQPPYTLTVSISDPAVTVSRAELHSTAGGPVLAADNHV
ncbi:hypothetical protein KDL01_02560 [Actinospica durhamensis]|uniref:Uncharacterized protein n=1 Tax=Actinospica durhamensis TaxID=1508375 RepID=A0A941INK3_9ACTN|nr:hypothetical protein [Actinospica durhamensis]MBR7832122.1 hypothetical protein [Actinospica durhamensis]